MEGGTSLVSLVPVSELWVDANYKENQIAGMKPGMKAEIRADILKGKCFTVTLKAFPQRQEPVSA